jgi:F-type H+-transporting ATPase subunit epsilon
MAETPFTFRLVTPQRLVLETEIVALEAPGSEGYLGVLAHHAPLITALRPGRLELRSVSGETRSYAVSGGFLEVSGNRATVLADTAEEAGAIDRPRAEAALRRAEERLQQASGGAGVGGASAGGAAASVAAVATEAAIDRQRALRALERAKNRLGVATEDRG